MRQIVLDTETTGLDANRGHRLVEIGCIEMVQRRPTGRPMSTLSGPRAPTGPPRITTACPR